LIALRAEKAIDAEKLRHVFTVVPFVELGLDSRRDVGPDYE